MPEDMKEFEFDMGVQGFLEGVKESDKEVHYEKNEDDPFNSTNAPGINLVVSMRLYDVLMGLYMHFEPEKATAMYEMHSQGKILGSLPMLDMNEDT